MRLTQCGEDIPLDAIEQKSMRDEGTTYAIKQKQAQREVRGTRNFNITNDWR